MRPRNANVYEYNFEGSVILSRLLSSIIQINNEKGKTVKRQRRKAIGSKVLLT
jgi:hypothetical protein